MVTLADELDRCRPWIEASLAHVDTHDFEDVAAAIRTFHMQLWPSKNGCVVTQISVHPKKKLLTFFIVSGNLKELNTMMPMMERWAKAQGCDGMIAFPHRKGWERFLGWPRIGTINRKDF